MTASRACNYLQNAAATTYKKFLQFYAKRSCKKHLGCTERMVSICAKDSGGPYNYDLVTTLSNIARELDLDYAIDVYPHYGSDVETALRAGYDIRHGLIGPGVYASHNYERSHMDGVRNTFELLKAYITK